MKIRSIVFQIAHIIKARCKYDFSQALRTAWVIAKMHFGQTVEFAFRKVDGELRYAVGTDCTLYTLDKGYVCFKEVLSDGSTQWRSFKVGRLA